VVYSVALDLKRTLNNYAVFLKQQDIKQNGF